MPTPNLKALFNSAISRGVKCEKKCELFEETKYFPPPFSSYLTNYQAYKLAKDLMLYGNKDFMNAWEKVNPDDRKKMKAKKVLILNDEVRYLAKPFNSYINLVEAYKLGLAAKVYGNNEYLDAIPGIELQLQKDK